MTTEIKNEFDQIKSLLNQILEEVKKPREAYSVVTDMNCNRTEVIENKLTFNI